MTRYFSFLFLLSLFLSSCSQTTATPSVNATPTINIIIPTPVSCTSIVAAPTPGPQEPSIFQPIGEQDHVRGAEEPVFTVMDYSDYQDPRSALFTEAVDRLLEENPDEVRVVSRIFPLISVNDKAAIAAQAAEAAAEQDKFWEVRDLLYQQQANWVSLSAEDFEQWIAAQASTLGLNVDQFQADMKREDIVAEVQKGWEDGQKMGLPGTPLVLINGQIYGGPRDYNSLNDILQLILLGRKQFIACPPVTVQGNKQYIATLQTEKGDIVIQLFADKAPFTVNSFLFLARNGWYDNITFHRVIPELFAQSGDPSGTGRGNPGYYVVTEIDPSLKFDKPGMLAMVNSGPDTSGSQFFITYGPAAQFDGQYTIFGQVLSGMDVLEQLTPRDAQPGQDTPPGDQLVSITIEEK
ncbi:MAG TPA: peptidylprolyl isomerase [Anaerolineales bacterium]|nr:peptidylprolyl isomerase [Anaerolineales bacterium]